MNDTLTIFTATGFNQVEIENFDGIGGDLVDYTGDGFAINQFGFNTVNSGSDVPLEFDLEAEDEDGDTSTGQIGVTVTPDDGTITGTANDESLVGGDGADTLIGDDGADILAGGLGLDNLFGNLTGGGAGDNDVDTFIIEDTTAVDIIGDFEATVDQIDLTALLDGIVDVTDLLSSGHISIDVASVPGSTIIQVDADGAAGLGVSVDAVQLTGTFGADEITILFGDDSGGTGSDLI